MEAVRLAAVPPEARLSGVLRRTVPVTAKAFPPMDAPPRANEVPLATPRVGVVKTMLVAAILLVRDYIANPIEIPSEIDKTGRLKSGAKNKEALRTYLYSTLFSIWVLEFEIHPKINNKHNLPTPFTKFAAPILKREKFGKFIDHAEKYQSYRAKAIALIEPDPERTKESTPMSGGY